MNWDRVSLGITDVLGVLLIFRFSFIRLQRTYFTFVAFVILQFLVSTAFVVDVTIHPAPIDYRVLWLLLAPATWLAELWVVYTVLGMVLRSLPGLLRASRTLLNIAFPTALVVSAVTVFRTWAEPFSLVRALSFGLVLERVFATGALITLAIILAFVLWFPVRIPRNLMIFSFVFVVYFTGKEILLILQSFLPRTCEHLLSAADTGLLGCCFLVWIALITPKGETAQVRIGHSWEPAQQKKLLDQLEGMNSALLRQARRS